MRDPLGQWLEQSSGQGPGQYPGRCSDKEPGKLMAWLDRELSDAEAAAVERHVRACTECASRAEAYRQTSMAFEAYCEACCEAALAAPALKLSAPLEQSRPASLPEGARGELAGAAISRSIARGRAGRRGFPRWALGWAGAGAAAVAVLLVVWPRGRLDRPASPGAASVAISTVAGSNPTAGRAASGAAAAAELHVAPKARTNPHGIEVRGIAAPNLAAMNAVGSVLGDGRELGAPSLPAPGVAAHSTSTRKRQTGAAILAAANAGSAAVAGLHVAIAPASSAGNSANVASWTPAEPAIQIAIPAAAMFPPGAVPEGLTFIADVTIAADGSAERLRLRP
jgi:anti-sigma factor RsiW